MARDGGSNIADDRAAKFDEVVAGGPYPLSQPAPVRPDSAAAPPDAAGVLRKEIDGLREDMRQGLGAAAQLQFDAIASLRAQVERLNVEMANMREAVAKPRVSDLAWNFVRDQMLELATVVKSSSGTQSADLSSVASRVELLRQDLASDRSHRDAVKESVLDGIASLREEVRTGWVELESGRSRSSQGEPAELVTAIAALGAEGNQVREFAIATHRDLIQTLEAFHDELVEQWRARKAFEASVDAGLESIRLLLADAVAEFTAGRSHRLAQGQAVSVGPANVDDIEPGSGAPWSTDY